MISTRQSFIALFACLVAAASARSEPKLTETVLPTQNNAKALNVRFSADSSQLFYWDGASIAVWNIPDKKITTHLSPAAWMYVKSADSTLVATDLPEDRIAVYNVATGQLVREIKRIGAANKPKVGEAFFRSCGFDEKNQKFFTRDETSIKVWDVKSGKMLRELNRKRPPFNNMPSQSPDGRYLAIEGTSGAASCELLDTRTESWLPITDTGLGKLIGKPHGGFMSSVGSWSFSRDDKMLFGIDELNHVLVAWSLPTGKMVDGVVIEGAIFGRVSPDASRMVYVRGNGSRNEKDLYIWDLRKKAIATTIGPLPERPSWYDMSPDNRWACACVEGGLKLWDLGAPPTNGRKSATSKPAQRD